MKMAQIPKDNSAKEPTEKYPHDQEINSSKRFLQGLLRTTGLNFTAQVTRLE